MQESQYVWRLGGWFASKRSGDARLTWESGHMKLNIAGGRIVGATGLDSSEVSRRLETRPHGHDDLLEEARALADNPGIAEPQAVGAAKEVIQHAFLEWLRDTERHLSIDDCEDREPGGLSISVTHAIVETVLSSPDQDLGDKILPETDSILRRSVNFLDLYGPLRLSEEADLIVAKISGERTAKEIAEKSPHGNTETMRLLCALIATGMVEVTPPEPRTAQVSEPEVDPVEEIPVVMPDTGASHDFVEPRPARKLPIAWFVVALAALIIVVGALAMWLKSPTEEETTAPIADIGPQWGLVVDMGCAPDDFRRILKATHAHPNTTQPVAIGQDDQEPCWQLAWGAFESQADAEGAIDKIPSTLRRDEFSPHAIVLPEDPVPLDELESAGN